MTIDLAAAGDARAAAGRDKGSAQQPLTLGTRVHKMPLHDGLRSQSAPAGAHLTYYGGRVVSNLQVVQVLWGTGSYLPQVTSSTSPSMATFYQGVLNSPYVDWLGEYDTTTQGGTRTNQSIGRGAFVSTVTITPASSATTIDDSTIQTELAQQLTAGHLPAPTQDAAGNNNTYYAVFFPHGKTVTQGGSSSCVAGGFCAYHGTVANVPSFGEIYYGVHPDMQSGSGCDTGCGNAATAFGNYTSVASHEMIETVTDCEVGLATINAPPLAWYDSTNGEIGDICNAQQGSITGSDGVSYVVQQEFSNVASDCIVTRAVTVDDFSLAASPASVSVAQGASGTSSISTAVTSGSAVTIALSASGAPAGVTASLAPTPVTSGQSSTLTLSASSAAAAGTYTITVTGTGPTTTHSATVSLTVTATTVVNDFSISASPASVSVAQGASGSSTISTAVTSGSATTISLSASGAPSGVTATLTPASVSGGQSATLGLSATAAAATGTFTVTVTGVSGSATHSATVSLTVTSGVVAGGLVNGDFEAGTFSGWTTSGASETIVSAGCHGGSFCAQLGSTGPTSGDSRAAQTFTAPAGSTGLSLWYRETCPDTVVYDWALVTLKDNTAGTSTNVVGKRCATADWTNATSTVVAGHSYTLTLVSHDDNFAADPTFTLYDDVALTSGGGGGAGVTNGGFESGFTGWTTAGVTSIVSSPCHGGAACARLGSTAPTNGSATASQTFTAPAGKSQLSVWYAMSCPDTVRYDWAVVRLRDNTAGTTAVVLPRTCARTLQWSNVTAAITAGHSYTLVLESHDDNFPGDPTYTLYDDVGLN